MSASPSAWACPRVSWREPARPPAWPGCAAVPVRRYEKASAGELLHLDTKKLGCFDKPGHRVTGDRTKNTPRAGWQALHVAIDDHSRVGFSLMLADEKATSACSFVLDALRYYKALGVRVERVMTDNGSAYKSRRFAKLLRRLAIKHIRTRPYTPRTNARPNASSRLCCASGPMPSSIQAHNIAPTSYSPECTTTTSIALTRPSQKSPQLLDSASMGTTS